MLLRHSGMYLFARGLPGILSLLTLALYSRILPPSEYGGFAIVTTVVNLGNAVLFQWLRLSVLRFLPTYKERMNTLLSTIAYGFGWLMVGTLVMAVLGAGFAWRSIGTGIIVTGTLLLWAQAWFELNQELYRSQLSPRKYGVLSTCKAALALMCGWALVKMGFGAEGALVGTALGTLLPLVWVTKKEWSGIRLTEVDRHALRRFIAYGLPLTVNFALGFVVSSSDRLLLGWLIDTETAGLYSVGYDLPRQTVGVLMLVVNLAAYPLAVRALEQQGIDAAKKQLSQNVQILLALALPATVGLIMLAPNIAGVLLGTSFQQSATLLMPWIAAGALLEGLKAYYVDHSFQLGHRTLGQVWVALGAAFINTALNLLLIPNMGMLGAAYATLIAYALGLLMSWFSGRRVFALPLPVANIAKVVVAVFGMALALLPLRNWVGAVPLALQIFTGAVVYGAILFALNFAGIRGFLRRRRVHA